MTIVDIPKMNTNIVFKNYSLKKKIMMKYLFDLPNTVLFKSE